MYKQKGKKTESRNQTDYNNPLLSSNIDRNTFSGIFHIHIFQRLYIILKSIISMLDNLDDAILVIVQLFSFTITNMKYKLKQVLTFTVALHTFHEADCY